MISKASVDLVNTDGASPLYLACKGGHAECARMLLTEDLCGPLLQSGLDSEDYLNGPYVSAVYKKPLSLTTL